VIQQRIESQLEGSLGRITLSAGPLNVLNVDDLRTLTATLWSLDACAVIAIGARGERAFSAGVEVADHVPERAADMLEAFSDMAHAFRNAAPILVCGVGAAALGGGFELALLADLLVCSERAFFALPEVQLAALPPIACALLPRMVGERRALDAILRGTRIDAQTAYAWGLVNEVVPHGELSARVDALCDGLLAYSRDALLACKRAVRSAKLDAAMEIYRDDLLPTADAAEGINAFLEKRSPIWETHR